MGEASGRGGEASASGRGGREGWWASGEERQEGSGVEWVFSTPHLQCKTARALHTLRACLLAFLAKLPVPGTRSALRRLILDDWGCDPCLTLLLLGRL